MGCWRRGRDPGGSSERAGAREAEGERREAVSERRRAGREQGREEGGVIFGPDLSAEAPRSTAIGRCPGHAEPPIGQALGVEGPSGAHSPAGFKARVGWAGSGMERADWPGGGRLGWGRREPAVDWVGLVKALSSDRLSPGRRMDRRHDSEPARLARIVGVDRIGCPRELRGVRGRGAGRRKAPGYPRSPARGTMGRPREEAELGSNSGAAVGKLLEDVVHQNKRINQETGRRDPGNRVFQYRQRRHGPK
ncbi:uncharacterized protein [Symphalangus syndactylus]|uniref:uncharacterized protein isoform X2 n=1 Tax=Symphalangus syndactylus TaxID=9590 RepID=UPI0030044CEC